MNQALRNDADRIIRDAIAAVQPDAAVGRALAEPAGPRKKAFAERAWFNRFRAGGEA